MEVLKVAASSDANSVARAILGALGKSQLVETHAIGAGAVNQAVKALALSKGYLKEDGYEVIFIPEFVDVEIDDKIRTAIKFTVELR